MKISFYFQITNLQMHIKELTEQNMRLKDKVAEARENSKKIQQDLGRSQQRCSEVESWNSGNQEMRDNIIKKLQEEKEELDKEVQTLKKGLASLNLTNGNYDSDIVELNRDRSRTTQELQECQEHCNFLQQENQSLKHDLLAAEKKIKAIQGDWGSEEMEESGRKHSSLLYKLDVIRDKLRIYRENCSWLENEVKIYKEKLDFCNQELHAKKGQVEEFKESYDFINKGKARLECLLSETQLKLEKSEEDVMELKAENQDFKERIGKLETKIHNLRDEKANMAGGVSKPVKQDLESSANFSRLQQQVGNLEKELSSMSQKLSETEADLCRNQTQVEQLSLQLKESLDKIAELETRRGSKAIDGTMDSGALLQQTKRQAQEVRFTLQRKDKESKDLEKKLKETREEIHKMEIQGNLGEAQRSQLTEEIEKEKENFLKLQEEFIAYQQGISKQKASEDFYKQELASKDVIIAEQKVTAANMELKYHELSEQYTATQELHEQYKREIQEIEDDLLQTQRDMADMQVGFTVAENEKEELKQQLLAANKTITDLKSKLELAEQDVKEKEHENSLTTQRLTRMEEELEEASRSKSYLELQLHESNTKARRKGDEESAMQNQMEELQRTCEGLRQQVSEKELVVERLKDEISSLETDLGTLRTELSYKDSLHETSAEELKRLTLKLKSSEEEIARLTELSENTLQEKGTLHIELSVANKKIESMESNLKENGEKESNLVKTLQEERNKFVYKETDMDSYRSKIAALEFQCENHVKERDELRRKVYDLDERATTLKHQLDEVSTSKDQAIRQRMELEEKVLEMQQDIEESSKTRLQHEGELQDLCSKLAKYEVQIETLKRQNDELKEKTVETNIQVVNQREELMKLEISTTEHQKMRESVQSDLEQKSKDYEDMQSTIKGLQTELKKAKNNLITSKMSHEFALDENSRLARKMQEQETKLVLLEKEVSDANEENKKVSVDLGCQSAKLNNLHLQLTSALREKERFKDDLQTAEKKLQKIQEELLLAHNQVREKERIAESYRIEMCEKESQIEQLKTMKESFEEKNLALKKELQTITFYHESSESKLKGAQYEISSLRRKLNQYETTVDTLVKERDDIDKANEDSAHQQQSFLLEQSKERQASLEKEIATNKANISRLERDVKMSRQDCLDSQFEHSKSQRLLEDLEVTYELCDKERRALREEVLEINRKISDLELKYENEQKDNLALQSQLEDATNRGDTNRNEILKLSKQCVEQKIRLDAVRKENEQKNSQIEELKADKVHLEEKSVELRSNLTSAIGECEKLRGGHQQLQDEIIAQQKTISNLKDRLQRSIKTEQAVQEDLKLKIAEIESLNEEMAVLNDERDELKNKGKRLENALNKQREDLANAGNQIAELRDDVLQNKKELGSKQSEITDLEADKCALKEELDQTKDALKRLKIEFQSVEESKVVVSSPSLQSNLFDEDDLEEESGLLEMKESLNKVEANLQKSIANEYALQDEVESLKNTNTQLQNNLQSLKERERVLKTRSEDSQRELDHVKSDLKKFKDNLNISNTQLEMVQEKADQLEAQNSRLEDTKNLLMEELKGEQGKVRRAEDECLEVQCKLQELQTRWDHTEREAEGNETVLDTVKSEKKCLERDIQTLRDELSSAHALMNTTLKKNRELDEENFQLKKTIAEYETKEEGFEQEQDELNRIVAQHQKDVKDLQLQVQQRQKEASALKEEVENERQKLNNAKDDYDNLLRDLSQFKGGVKDNKKTMSEKDARILLLENMKTNLEAELRSEVLKKKEAEDEFEQKEQKLNEIIQEKDNRISELDYSIKKLKERNKKLQTDLSEIKASSSEQTSALYDAQKEIKKVNSEVLSQGPVITTLKTKNAALDEEKQRLKEEINKLKRQCSEQTIQLDALRHENDRLQRKVNEVHTSKNNPVKKPQTSQNTMETDLVSRKKIIELESAYQNIALEKEDAENKNRSLMEKNAELEQELNEYLTAKDALEKESEWKDRRISELEDSLHKAEYSAQLDRNELQAAVKAKTAMESELNSAKNAILGLEECNATYEEMIKELEDKIADVQQKNARLENALETSQRKVSSQMKELIEMQKKVCNLENMTQSNTSSNDELLRNLQSCKNKIASLEDKLCVSAREQAKANVMVKETKEQNAILIKELQQVKCRLREENHDREMDGKEMREKDEMLKKIHRENRELENELSAATKEMIAKTTELLTLMNKQEDTQEELETLKKQIAEFESSWMNEKGENEKLKLEMSTSRKLYSDLKMAYDNILNDINSSQDQLDERDSINSTEVQKLKMEKEQLNNEIQLLNKRIIMLKENNEKSQREKKDVEQKLKTMQQRLLVLEADEKTVDTIKTLQRELEESKQKIHDLNAMYEAVRLERDNLRSENKKPKSPRSFGKYEARPRSTSSYLDNLRQKSKINEQSSSKMDMFEAQARAVLLEEKLRVARERLEGLKTFAPNSTTCSTSEDSVGSPESTEDASEVFTDGDENQES